MESNQPPLPPLQAESFAPPATLRRLQGPALVTGLVGLVVTGIGFLVDRPHFYQAWLTGWVLWLSVALGCLGLLMLHHMTHGGWGLVIRRPLEAAARTLPLLLVLFVPVVLGMHDLYHWTHEEAVRADKFLTAKAPYLNEPFFLVRAGIYFACWLGLAWYLDRLSRRQDEGGDGAGAIYRRLQATSAAGFLLLALTSTFASIDWLMSLDPHWFSSLYGLWFFAGMGLSGLVFSILVAGWLGRRDPMRAVIRPRHFHDYGKLFFAFVMLWAYLSFSQYLLIWSANLPEEIPFYLRRMHGAWAVISVLLLLAHFVLPFLILLSADVKQRSRTLVKVAAAMLVMRWVDYFWNVGPTLHALHSAAREAGHSAAQAGVAHSPWAGLWIDLAAPVGIGGLFVWFFVRQLAARPLLPVGDPFLAEAVAQE
jgi:hypothetical protein